MKKKSLLVSVPLVMHTKLAFVARQEGKSMSAIVRESIQGYLDGTLTPAPVPFPRAPHPKGRGNQDVYDELEEMVREAVE